MRRSILLILFIVLSVTAVFAVMAKPGTGLVGDEFCHYREGESPPQQALMESARLRRAAAALQTSFPTTGEVSGLVILVNFADVKFVTPDAKAAFMRMLNSGGYSENHGTGSARDYFIASSDSLFRPNFDVYGPYTVSKNMSYYGSNSAQGYDQHPGQMVEEACHSAEADGVDFAKYDLNNDGYVDNVFIYYAGYNEAEGGPANSIWPHRSQLMNPGTVSGKRLLDYACTSELTGTRGSTMCGIGTFCHEFSHVLGLPDMYNTSHSDTYTVGAWDIMAGGNYNNNGRTPPTYTGFERFMMGWLVPEQLTNPSDYVLRPLETDTKVYLIATEEHNMDPAHLSPSEFWLIENRQKVGWDAPNDALPGVGLLITHISFNRGTWENNTFNNRKPLGFDVCEAYSRNPYAASPSDTYPGYRNVTTFVPNSNDQELLFEHTVNNIRYSGDLDIVFHYGESKGVGFDLTPRVLPIIESSLDNGEITFYPETLAIKGQHLSGSSVFVESGNDDFEVSATGYNWGLSTNMPFTGDSTFEGEVYVRHVPTRKCVYSAALLAISTDDRAFQTQTQLLGYSSRPIFIKPVEAEEAEEVTPYTFVARWQEQTDAEFYYLTLHKLSKGSTTLTPKIDTTLFDAEGVSVLTEVFPTAAKSLQFTLKHTFSGEETNGGVMYIEGQTTRWEVVDSIVVHPITPDGEQQYTFPNEKYSRFRFRYHHLNGTGNVRLSNCSIALNRAVETIYSGEEYELYAPLSEAQLENLQPNTEYSYQLQAMEEKGCERHLTVLGRPMTVTTLRGADNANKNFTVYVRADKTVVAYLPRLTEAKYKLMLYSASGKLVEEIAVPDYVYEVEIPTDKLVFGDIYLIKYAEDGRLSRKARWAKFLYR